MTPNSWARRKRMRITGAGGAGGGGASFDLSTASAEGSRAIGLNASSPNFNPLFSEDGLFMWLAGTDGADVLALQRRTLTTAFAPVDGSTVDHTVSLTGSTLSNPRCAAINPEGTVLLVMDETGKIARWNFTGDPWDSSSISFVSESATIASTQVFGMTVSPDGEHVIMARLADDTLYEWEMTTGWDPTSLQTTGRTLVTTAFCDAPLTARYSGNGEKLYVAGNTADTIQQISLPTLAYTLSDAAADGVGLSVSGIIGVPTGIAFNADNTRLVVSGHVSPNGRIAQWSGDVV